MPRVATLLIAGTFVLAACAGARDPAPSGGAPEGAAACSRACSRDYDVCMEAGAARGAQSGTLRGLSCDRQYRRCVAACRAAS